MGVEQNSGFRPVGPPEVVAENRWFKTIRQPMDFLDPSTGIVKRSSTEDGEMNYIHIREPGVLVVADIGGHSTVLVPQERYTVNLVEGKPVRHFDAPGGAISEGGEERDVIAAAQREFAEEAGMGASDFVLVGNRRRGLLPHPFIDDGNPVVIARGVYLLDGGAAHDDEEILGQAEQFTWRETEDMYLLPDGMETPTGLKIISSAPTVAALALTRVWLERQSELGPTTLV